MCVAGCLVGLTQPLPAHAQATEPPDIAAAEQFAQEAFDAYQAQRYVEAVALYRKAYQAAPSAAMLYNLARIYDKALQDGPLAMTFYRQFIADPEAEPEQVRTANERLLALRAAEQTQLSQPPVQPAPPPPLADPPRQADTGSLSALQVGGMVMAAAGLVGIGVGVRYGLVAMDEADTVSESCDGNKCRTREGLDAASSASDNALVSTLGYAIGAGLVAGGLLMWVFGESSADEQVAIPSVRLSPVLAPATAGLRLEGVL